MPLLPCPSRLWLLSLFCLILQPVFSQPPAPRIISSKDYLGARGDIMVFDIESDSNGFVYFAGPGLLKFDGSTPRALNPDGSAYFTLYKDQFGQIWGRTSKGKLDKVAGDSVQPFPLPDSIENSIRHGLESLYRDREGVLHLAPRGRGYITVSPQGEITQIKGRNLGIHGAVISRMPNGSLFFYTVLQRTKQPLSYYFQNEEGEIQLIAESKMIRPVHEATLVSLADGSGLLSLGNNEILHFKGDSLIELRDFGTAVIQLFQDQDEGLWVGTINKGVFHSPDGDLSKLRHFPNTYEDMAVVAQDINKGLWFKSGLIRFGYMEYNGTPHYSLPKGMERNRRPRLGLTTDGETAYYLTESEDLVMVTGDSMSIMKIPLNLLQPNQRDIFRYPSEITYEKNSGDLWLSYWSKVARWDGTDWTNYELDPIHFKDRWITALKSQPDGSIWGSTRYEVFTIRGDSIAIVCSFYGIDVVRGLDLDEDGLLWVTGYKGLWIFEDGEIKRPFDPMPAPLLITVRSNVYALGTLWVNPSGHPAIRLTRDGWEIVRDNQGESLAFGDVTIATDGSLWCRQLHNGTSLWHFYQEGDSLMKEEFAFDDFAGEAVSKGVFGVTDEYVFWGTSAGLFQKPKTDLIPDRRAPNSSIREIRVNHQKVPLKPYYPLEYNQNSLNIIFDAVSFQRLPITYRYRLNGLDTAWIESEFQQAQYTNLAPGDYRFVVQSRAKQRTWSPPIFIDFHVARPFWETWWVRIGAASVFLGLLFLLIRFRTRQVQRAERTRADIALEMSQLEMRALKAQINPHFIFNAMSSVQYYLSQNQPDEARDYVQRFSSVMRSVLENSEQTRVPLSGEIQLMRHYIGLESERFSGVPIQFDVTLNDIDAENVLIPPTLFQPYIENAIWHGLKPKKEDRMIHLSVKRSGDHLSISITDNGIGRKAASANRSRPAGQRSFGMMIASRRIEVLNQNRSEPVVVHDLANETGTAIGTRVDIQIPLETWSETTSERRTA